ncbi:MAG: beta-barrel assembly-enhancing protease [Planctomycetota bacterium]
MPDPIPAIENRRRIAAISTRRSVAAIAIRRSVAAIAILAFAAACSHDDGSHFNPMDLVVPSYSDDDLRQLGMDADREIQKQVEIIYDPIVSGYLNELGQELASQIAPQPFIYRFRIINAKSLNAFALPGGYIYIHSETLMRVGSVDELAGVLGHEIAHVQARHFSRREAKTALPGLAARVIGMGAAVAAKEPGLAAAGEGVNVSLKIGFTREYEAEADKLGAIWVTRAGYDPAELTHFLDKIIQSTDGFPDYLPPSLATHPFPEDRIHAIEADAESLHPKRVPDPEFAAALPLVQARLAFLLKTGRSSLNPGVLESSDPRVDAVIEQAKEAAERGDRDGALLLLSRIDGLESANPQIPFLIGELLYASGRYAEAAASYLRATQLDASRALVFFKLGEAFEAAGQPHRAVYAFEQAVLRTAEESELRKRSEWEIYKLTFVPIEASGFAEGSISDAIDAASDALEAGSDESTAGFDESTAGFATPIAAELSTEVSRIAWWARLGSRFRQYADEFDVRWIEPSGKIALEKSAKKRSADTIGSVLEFGRRKPAIAGRWTLEIALEDDVVDRQTFVIRQQPNTPQPL